MLRVRTAVLVSIQSSRRIRVQFRVRRARRCTPRCFLVFPRTSWPVVPGSHSVCPCHSITQWRRQQQLWTFSQGLGTASACPPPSISQHTTLIITRTNTSSPRRTRYFPVRSPCTRPYRGLGEGADSPPLTAATRPCSVRDSARSPESGPSMDSQLCMPCPRRALVRPPLWGCRPVTTRVTWGWPGTSFPCTPGYPAPEHTSIDTQVSNCLLLHQLSLYM